LVANAIFNSVVLNNRRI